MTQSMALRTLLEDDTCPNVAVTGLCEHTDEVHNNFAFIATAPDPRVAAAHARAAQASGAAAILSVGQVDRGSVSIPVVEVTDLPVRKGPLAAKFYGEPTRGQEVIGVTGTNGKTSVAYHIADLSEALGAPTGYFGTLGCGRVDDLAAAGLTTANAVALQRHARSLRDQGVQRLAIEVSSHALDQGRVKAVHFDCAVFTNLTRDHLDYHGSLAAYGDAKRRLFAEWPLQAAVLNADDPFTDQLMDANAKEVVTYGKRADWRWHKEQRQHGMFVRWQSPYGELAADLPVVADFAVANITAAIAVLALLDHSVSAIERSLESIAPVPGRMQIVDGGSRAPIVVVDYAHTPDALAKALTTLREVCRGRLICVVGCGGDRDTGKRAQMGRIASTTADTTFLTSDNPRSEDPLSIIDDMQEDIAADAQVTVCADRGRAIADAIAGAGAGDTVLIAGKGHEDYQEIAGRRVHFDDAEVAAAALAEVR